MTLAKPKMTSADIELAIIQTWKPRQNLMVPNVSWGFVPWGEIDILKVEKSMYLTEIEIKLTLADLKREWGKKRWAPVYYDWFRKKIRRYYIAMPEDLYEQLCSPEGRFPWSRDGIPDWVGAGVLTVDGRFVRERKKPRINKEAAKLTCTELAALGRLGTLRYWALRTGQASQVQP